MPNPDLTPTRKGCQFLERPEVGNRPDRYEGAPDEIVVGNSPKTSTVKTELAVIPHDKHLAHPDHEWALVSHGHIETQIGL